MNINDSIFKIGGDDEAFKESTQNNVSNACIPNCLEKRLGIGFIGFIVASFGNDQWNRSFCGKIIATRLATTGNHQPYICWTDVTIDFADGTDMYWARQQVAERITQVLSGLPEGVEGGLAPITMKGTRPALGWVAAGFIVVTGVELSLQAAVKEEVEQQYAESTQQIIEASTDPEREPFTGRYLLGPANAPIRLVLISDFQCSDCKIFEQQVRKILARHDNVSVSMKHFPFCTACNQYATKNLHPNACWAARAAEAAGILRGNDGFWQMHRWLFDRSASFTDGEIRAALAQFGYDVREFLDVMQGEETLRRVQADIEEATRLGLFRTPMIFINGVELKGWMAQPNALVRAVDELAARKPPPGSATQDHPPPAFEKYVADWRDQPQRSLPDDARAWNMGPDGAVVDIVAWGDYQEPFSAEADGRLRRITASRGDTRYTFRHYPIDQACNPVAPRTLHPLACLASRAAEAAGTIAGSDGYWAMHAWLFDDLDRLSEQTLAEAAAELGIDQGLLFTEMRSRAVTDAIAADARAGKVMGLDSVPFIFINGKRVPHWRKKGLLDAMVDEAARGQSSTSR